MFRLRITDNLEVEKWRNVVDYYYNIIDGYLISNKGTLRSVDRFKRGKNGSSVPVLGRILIPYTKRGTSYKRATLFINGKMKHFYVHSLVALAFPEICGKYFEGAQVDHINGNGDDNMAENLRWCTAKMNANNPNTYGRMVMKSVINLQETRTEESVAKSRKAKLKKVVCVETGKIYSSRFEAAKELNIHPDSVWCCCSGRYKRTRNGYSFRFA